MIYSSINKILILLYSPGVKCLKLLIMEVIVTILEKLDDE